jgi:hypothetical protein
MLPQILSLLYLVINTSYAARVKAGLSTLNAERERERERISL